MWVRKFFIWLFRVLAEGFRVSDIFVGILVGPGVGSEVFGHGWDHWRRELMLG